MYRRRTKTKDNNRDIARVSLEVDKHLECLNKNGPILSFVLRHDFLLWSTLRVPQLLELLEQLAFRLSASYTLHSVT
jgi:hypothetical protein